MKTEILNQNQITQKTERIAFQIYENFHSESQIFIGGIEGNGFIFAERLVEQLEIIAGKDFKDGIRLFSVKVNKDNPLEKKINLSIEDDFLKDANVILVDDVINSGRTLIHAVSRLLENRVRCIKTAILVNRTHRRYPISADFVGMDITTTLQDNIRVELGKTETAYLV